MELYKGLSGQWFQNLAHHQTGVTWILFLPEKKKKKFGNFSKLNIALGVCCHCSGGVLHLAEAIGCDLCCYPTSGSHSIKGCLNWAPQCGLNSSASYIDRLKRQHVELW